MGINIKGIENFCKILKNIYTTRKEKIYFQKESEFLYISDGHILLRIEKDYDINYKEGKTYSSWDCIDFEDSNQPDLKKTFQNLHKKINKEMNIDNHLGLSFSSPAGVYLSKEYAISKLNNLGIFLDFEYLNTIHKITKILKVNDIFNIWYIPEPIEPIYIENNDIKIFLTRIELTTKGGKDETN